MKMMMQLPASCGSSGSGVASNACKLSNTVRIVIAAALHNPIRVNHSFSSQISCLPLIFENIQTNSSSNGTDIWMPDFRGKSNFWWIKWIGI